MIRIGNHEFPTDGLQTRCRKCGATYAFIAKWSADCSPKHPAQQPSEDWLRDARQMFERSVIRELAKQ